MDNSTVLKVWKLADVYMLHIGDSNTGQSVRVDEIKRLYYKPINGENACELELKDGGNIQIHTPYSIAKAALNGCIS